MGTKPAPKKKPAVKKAVSKKPAAKKSITPKPADKKTLPTKGASAAGQGIVATTSRIASPVPAAPLTPEQEEVALFRNHFPASIDECKNMAATGAVQIEVGKVKIGMALLIIKAESPHGDWTDFIEKRWPTTPRSAQRYMSIARAVKNAPKLLAAANGNMEKTAALLAGNLTDDDVSDDSVGTLSTGELSGLNAKEIATRLRKEVKKSAAQGENITKLEKENAALSKAAAPVPEVLSSIIAHCAKIRMAQAKASGMFSLFTKSAATPAQGYNEIANAMASGINEQIALFQELCQEAEENGHEIVGVDITNGLDYLKTHSAYNPAAIAPAGSGSN